MTVPHSLWAALRLLDRQVVDVDGLPVAKVDDLEFAIPTEPGSLPALTTMLCGPAALAGRFGRRGGGVLEELHRLLSPGLHAGPAEISTAVVTAIGPALHIGLSRYDVPVTAVERWLEDKVVAKIPGAGREGGTRAPQ